MFNSSFAASYVGTSLDTSLPVFLSATPYSREPSESFMPLHLPGLPSVKHKSIAAGSWTPGEYRYPRAHPPDWKVLQVLAPTASYSLAARRTATIYSIRRGSAGIAPVAFPRCGRIWSVRRRILAEPQAGSPRSARGRDPNAQSCRAPSAAANPARKRKSLFMWRQNEGAQGVWRGERRAGCGPSGRSGRKNLY